MTIPRDAILDWILAHAAVVEQHKDILTELDAAVGDADHGYTLHRGWRAVNIRLPLLAKKDIGAILGGKTMVERGAGHQDPGATSSYLLLKAAADTWSSPWTGLPATACGPFGCSPHLPWFLKMAHLGIVPTPIVR